MYDASETDEPSIGKSDAHDAALKVTSKKVDCQAVGNELVSFPCLSRAPSKSFSTDKVLLVPVPAPANRWTA